MKAFNKKRKPKHMTKLYVLKDRIKCTYMKKNSFVNNDYIEYGGKCHELISWWKNKTGWVMETTVYYFPKEYRAYKEKIYKEKFPKYSGVRTFYYDNYNTTKHMSFEKF